MLPVRAIALSGLTSLLLVACGSAPGASEDTAASQSAVTSATTTACQTDSSCGWHDVCEPICPVIPGREHCEIAGGTCQPVCTRTASSLSGQTFTSADAAHSITFTSATQFTKTDGCSGTIHCEHVVLTKGTYTSTGTTVRLYASNGTRDTLSVESHCYEGLLDEGDGVDLYPAN